MQRVSNLRRFPNNPLIPPAPLREATQLNQANQRRIEETTPVSVERLKCPITLEIMVDPVMSIYGHHFERSAIEAHLRSNPTCPISRQPLNSYQLSPSLLMREVIETYNTEQGLREVHSAAVNMNIQLIQHLHSQGVRIMEPDHTGRTALDTYQQALRKEHESQGPPWISGRTSELDPDLFKQYELIDEIKGDLRSRISDAQKKGNLNAVNENGQTLLMETVKSSYLIELSANHKTVFFDFAEELLDMDIDIGIADQQGNNALFLIMDRAETPKQMELMERMFEKGINIDHQNESGDTVLLKALQCKKEKDDLIDYFLKKGADPQLTNKQGQNALMIAAENGQVQWVENLLRKHVDAKAVDAQGENAFIKAFKNGHRQCVELLDKSS